MFNPHNPRARDRAPKSTVARIVGGIIKGLGMFAALAALSVVLLWALTFAYNTTARVWHLPPMTWLEFFCTTGTIGAFTSAAGAGLGHGFRRARGNQS